MKKKNRLLLSIALTVSLNSFAEEKPKAPVAQKTAAEKIKVLESQLDSLSQKEFADPTFPVFLIEAKARISEASTQLKDNPKEEVANRLFSSCSLVVAAATIQTEISENQDKISGLQNKKDEILRKLNQLYRNINQIERNYSSNLRKDLTEERRKALEQQEEARRLAAEMERKFKDLESDVLSVRKDARGTILSMSDILFDIGKADLKGDLKTNLAKISGILTVYKDSHIIVEGHTDNQGSAEYNQKLSEKRAENVMNFLVEQGVKQERLTSKGYGFNQPIADNSTKEGRKQNRRVDIVIQEDDKKKQ